jgi:hypothetical protein
MARRACAASGLPSLSASARNRAYWSNLTHTGCPLRRSFGVSLPVSMLCFLRLGRGEVLTLRLFRRFVNASISRSGEFVVERLPAGRTATLFACDTLDGLHGSLDTEQPCCGLDDVAKAAGNPAVMRADTADTRARSIAVERQRERVGASVLFVVVTGSSRNRGRHFAGCRIHRGTQ